MLVVLQVAISSLQRMRGRLAELVADDTVDWCLGSVGFAVREVLGGERGTTADLLPKRSSMICHAGIVIQSELGAHDGVGDALDNLFLVERFEVAGSRFSD